MDSWAAIRPRISLESDANILNSVDCLFFFVVFFSVLPDAWVDFFLSGWSLAAVVLVAAAAGEDDVGMLMEVFVEASAAAAAGCSEGLGGETAGIDEGTAAAADAGTTGEGSVTPALAVGAAVPAAPGATAAATKFGEVGGEVDVGRLPPSRSLSPETSAAAAAAAADTDT